MRYKLSFLVTLVITVIFTSTYKIFSKSCIDNSKSNKIVAMLHSMAPAHQIIKNNNGTQIITEEGSFHLLENTETSIAVDANKVVIDLNGFTLSGSADILITVTANKEDVVIKNGAIVGDCTNTGIFVCPGAKRVILENLRISNCIDAVLLVGLPVNTVDCCKVTDCHVSNCTRGIGMANAEKCILSNCDVCCIDEIAFNLINCKYNKFEQCKAIGVGNSDADDSAIGFSSDSGLDNLFYECFAENIASCVDSEFCTKSAGFWFDPLERESKIINCMIDSITTVSFGHSFGVLLESQLLSGTEGANSLLGDYVVNDVDWSSQGGYLAFSLTSTSLVAVIKFDGIDLSWPIVDSVNFGDVLAKSVAWSPDGKYLAVGTDLATDYSLTNTVDFYRELVGTETKCFADFNVELTPGVLSEIYVYEFDYCINKLKLVDSKKIGRAVNSISNIGTWRWFCIAEDGFWEQVSTREEENLQVIGDSVSRLVWSNDCNHIYVLTEGLDIRVSVTVDVLLPLTLDCCPDGGASPLDFSETGTAEFTQSSGVFNFKFDGKKLYQLNDLVLDDDNSSRLLAISPDDQFLAYGRSESNEKLEIAKTNCGSLLEKVLSTNVTFTLANDADWNPTACCGRYYLAVVGDEENVAGSPINIQILEFNGLEIVNTFTSEDLNTFINHFDENLTSVKWSPMGKEFIVSGTDTVGFFAFDPQDANSTTTLQFSYDTDVLGQKFVDWSPCSRFVVIAGQPLVATDTYLEIIKVGATAERCVVEGNRVANVCGGLCGIGIFGAGAINLIDKNLVCCSGVKYSQGVYGKYLGGLLGFPGALDNLPGNDCCSCCRCVCSEPVCGCGCTILDGFQDF